MNDATLCHGITYNIIQSLCMIYSTPSETSKSDQKFKEGSDALQRYKIIRSRK